MLKQHRASLPDSVQKTLLLEQRNITPNDTQNARSSFDNEKAKVYFDLIRANLKAMNLGSEACAYCQSNEGGSIDHFKPIQKDTAGTLDWNNYFWACSVCNSNLKRTQFPELNHRRLLIKPDDDEPLAILKLTKQGKYFEHKVDKSDANVDFQKLMNQTTINVFGLNKRHLLVNERKLAWEALCKIHLPELLTAYLARDQKTLAKLEKQIKEPPLFPVFQYIRTAIHHSPYPHLLFPQPVLDAFTKVPMLKAWCQDWPNKSLRLFNALNRCVDCSIQTVDDSIPDLVKVEIAQVSGKNLGFAINHGLFLDSQGQTLSPRRFSHTPLKKFELEQGELRLHFHGKRIRLADWKNLELL